MPTLQQNLTEIRYLLDEPSTGAPSDRLLWALLTNQVTHHQAQLQNSSAQWSVNSWPLVTAAGTGDYLVTAENFGKPFWVHTNDTDQPQLARADVPFSMLQNTDMFYQGPVQPYISSSDLFSAVTISFYRTGESWYARLTPVPGGTVEYLVWYETAPGGVFNPGDSPGLSPFHHLIRTKTALAALPYCKWGGVAVDATDAKMAMAWERKTKTLGAALGMQAVDYERQFDTYLANIMDAGVERRQAFGDSYMGATEPWAGGWFGPNQFSR